MATIIIQTSSGYRYQYYVFLGVDYAYISLFILLVILSEEVYVEHLFCQYFHYFGDLYFIFCKYIFIYTLHHTVLSYPL